MVTWLQMGQLSSAPLRVVLLGLDGAGKTTVLYRLKFDQYVNSVPTIGFNCEDVRGGVGSGRAKGKHFVFWDVSGGPAARALWTQYSRAAEALVFVVDSSADVGRMEETKSELHRVTSDPMNTGVPILVLANKQDLREALSENGVRAALGVDELDPRRNPCRLLPTCAVNGEGLDSALEQMYEMIELRKKAMKAEAQKNAKNRKKLNF